MERRDLYEDDLTEERDPSPAQRDEVAATEVLDPDAPGGETVLPSAGALAGKTALGYPHGVPGGVHGDDEDDDEDEDDDDDDEDDES